MTNFLTKLCLVGAAVLFAAWFVLRYRGCFARATDALAKVSRARLAAFLFFVAIATVCAQKPGGTNEPPRGASVELRVESVKWKVENGGVVAAGDSTILHSTLSTLHSFRLESETTNETYSYAMPTNGMRRENWWLRGAYEDVFRLDLDGLLFPLGTNLCDTLWVYTWGMAGARLGDASNRIVATGAPMSAVPQVSRFWDAPTTNRSHLLTWENFFLNRDTNTPVSAQLELMPSGDFIARSNLVERLYRRVNPDDWDDDGIPNDGDIQPLAYDGDNFGPHQTLPEGASSNAYCWVDLVVPDANALVTFIGDGYSTLPDPTFVAKAGATNRVILLIGKTYHVTSRMPIACIGQSIGEIEVDQVSATELQIVWPVEIECVGMRSGASFAMSVWPDCLGGGFTWTNSCCNISSLGGGMFAYSCNDACHCGGCSATGYYGYEGYSLPACGGWCGCSGAYDPSPEQGDDDGPYAAGASATFSKSAVIFEDRYENAPGVWVERQSSQTELHCVAHGGPNGGHVRFEIAGENKLERVSGHLLPVEQEVLPGKKLDFTIVYKGQLPSTDAEDIVVTTTFTENAEGATPVSSQSKITSVKVELEAMQTAPAFTNSTRHTYGVNERIKLNSSPLLNLIAWYSSRGSTAFASTTAGKRSIYLCPLTNDEIADLSVAFADVTYTFSITVVEPQNVICRNPYIYDLHFPVGTPGGAGMRMPTFVIPESVSFSEIDMQEVPSETGSHTGYFNRLSDMPFWYHTVSMGAGEWIAINASNSFGVDVVTQNYYLDADWCAGEKVWFIPIGWRARGSTGPVVKEMQHDFSHDQVFVLTTNGTMQIEKYDMEVHRTIDDHIYLNGVQKK